MVASATALPIRPQRLPALTGMRFFAAFLVFADHASQEMLFSNKALSGVLFVLLSPVGPLGVCYFFVLSGFVLTWSAGENSSVEGFWRRRAAKILPNHLVVWFTGLVLMIIAGERLDVIRVVPSLFLVHPWLRSEAASLGTNATTWSLGAEAFFYLMFPWLITWLVRVRPERLWRWATAVTALIIAMPWIARLLPAHPSMAWSDVSLWRFWFVYELPPVRMLEFVLGILLARIVLTGRMPLHRRRWGLLLLFPAFVIAMLRPFALSGVLPDLFGVSAAFIVPVALLVVATARRDIAGKPSWVGNRTMRQLGEMSFGFFLIHWLVLHYGHQLFGTGSTFGPAGAVGFATGALAVSLALSWALWTYVEKPSMRRWASPRPVPVPQPPVATAASVAPTSGGIAA